MLVGVSRIPFLLYHHFILLFILGVVVTQGQISFQDTPYRTTLEEESPNGTYLLTVIAIDLAAGISSGSYSIVSNEFAIDALSGDLSTIAVIDRESPGTPLQFIFDVTFVSDDGELISFRLARCLQAWGPWDIEVCITVYGRGSKAEIVTNHWTSSIFPGLRKNHFRTQKTMILHYVCVEISKI